MPVDPMLLADHGASDYALSQRRAREEEERRLQVASDQANFVLMRARKLSNALPVRSDVQKFVSALADYLSKRRMEPGYGEIERRKNFVSACLEAISTRNQPALDTLLAEENIRIFKGWIYTRLYDIAKPFQFFSEKRREEIEKNLHSLPLELKAMVLEYDTGLYSYMQDPSATAEEGHKGMTP